MSFRQVWWLLIVNQLLMGVHKTQWSKGSVGAAQGRVGVCCTEPALVVWCMLVVVFYGTGIHRSLQSGLALSHNMDAAGLCHAYLSVWWDEASTYTGSEAPPLDELSLRALSLQTSHP